MSNRPLSIAGSFLMIVGLLGLAAGAMLIAAPGPSASIVEAVSPGPDNPSSGPGPESESWLEDVIPQWATAPFRDESDPDPTDSTPTDSATEATTPATVSAPEPVAIRIPSIDVAASMIPLGLRADRSIEVPEDFAQTGWWEDGPEPGEPGPAVVLGHVDSRSGPAVFFDLRNLQVGDEVVIDRVDGSSVTYRVDRLEQHPKDQFPTEAVYGSTPDPQLRLVTCGGEFDRSVRSYIDNVVVFASLVQA